MKTDSIFGASLKSNRKNANPFLKKKDSEPVYYTPRRDGLTMKRSVRKKMTKLEKQIEEDSTINESIKNKLKKELFRKINDRNDNFYDKDIKNNDDTTVGNDYSTSHGKSKGTSDIYKGLSKISDPEEREKELKRRRA